MNLLQIPIIDEYWVPPQDPASHNRSTDFAISMGFGEAFCISLHLRLLMDQVTVSHPPRLAQRSLPSALSRAYVCTISHHALRFPRLPRFQGEADAT